jgi:hypoxanthine phosphoribosyltransferase
MKLFDETIEIIVGPSSNNENSFNYYHKSNRKDIQIIRETLEKWFSEYPKSEKLELKSRFKKDLDSAFYELFLFKCLKN